MLERALGKCICYIKISSKGNLSRWVGCIWSGMSWGCELTSREGGWWLEQLLSDAEKEIWKVLRLTCSCFLFSCQSWNGHLSFDLGTVLCRDLAPSWIFLFFCIYIEKDNEKTQSLFFWKKNSREEFRAAAFFSFLLLPIFSCYPDLHFNHY